MNARVSVASPEESPSKSVEPAQAPAMAVTTAAIALNVSIFVVQLFQSGGASLMHLPGHEKLAFGASDALATVGENRWETLVTACFLHDGVLHLGLNMLVLAMTGPLLERVVGPARMASLYLVAGALGNLVSVGYSWVIRSAFVTVGASGAISGVVAAGLVTGWRIGGWRGGLTQAMARWMGFLLFLALLSQLRGANLSNAAHLGGAVAGAAMAAAWRPRRRPSERAAGVLLGVCAAVLVACIGLVAVHDRADPFAVMGLQERSDFTREALAQGHCREAQEGLRSVERLRARMAPVSSLRNLVESGCGHVE
jgi:rhomboid protease GluP